MPQMTLLEAINDALHAEMRNDDGVVVLGEDVGKKGGVFGATAGLHDEFGEERCFDTPLSECGIIGTAIGMAVYGLRADPRDPVPRLHLPGVRPDRSRGGEDALPLAAASTPARW